MRATNTNYNAQNILAIKQPVISIQFGSATPIFVSGQFADYNTTDYKNYIVNVQSNITGIDILEPNINSGQYTISLIDKGLEVTSFIKDNALFNKTINCKIGYKELNFSDFISLWQGIVVSLSLSEDKVTWVITARDALFNVRGSLFVGFAKTKLAGAITSTATNIDVDSTTGFINPASFLSNPDSKVKTAIMVDSEIMTYATINYTTNQFTVVRAQGQSAAAAHDDDSDVYQLIAFYCDPLRILLHLITTTNATAAIDRNGDYDLGAPLIDNSTGRLNDWLTMNIPISGINVTNIERIGWKIFSEEFEYGDSPSAGSTVAHGFLFAGKEPVHNSIEFIQDKLLRGYGIALKVGLANTPQGGGHPSDQSNKIDVFLCDYVDLCESVPVASFTDNSISIESFSFSETYLIRRLIWQAGYDWGANKFNYESRFTNTDVNTVYANLLNDIYFAHTGFPLTQTGGTTEAQFLTHRYMFFFDMPGLVTFNSFYSNSLIEPGDIIDITTQSLPNVPSESRIWTNKKALVVGQELDFVRASWKNYAIVWDTLEYVKDVVSGFYSVNKIIEANITDKTLAVDADESATVQAADAYVSNGSSFQADRIICFIRVTPPNYSSGSDFETIHLKITALNSVPASLGSKRVRYIRFNPKNSTAFTIQLDLILSQIETPDKIKIDWISTTATGGEIPTVEFIGAWFVKSNTKFT